MKTSVIEVRDMLSVLSVVAVEERIGEVSGVESVTVNHAAGTATVRYDETRLDVADIRSAVRQQGYESGEPAAASTNDGHKGHTAGGGPPAGGAPAVPAAPKTSAAAPAKAGADPTGAAQQNIAAPPAAPSLEGAAAPKPSATAATPSTPQPIADAAEKQHGDMGSHKS